MSRAEQAEQVRSELLSAARREFVQRGYHGATLDRIVDAAGYTKGVVYSRFRSKADLFLALLEERIEARAAANAKMAVGSRGAEGLTALAERWAQTETDDLEWTLLVIEFRVHAARHPELNARYAELHARTVAGVREVLTMVRGCEAADDHARMLLAAGVGSTLERAVAPDALPTRALTPVLAAIADIEPHPQEREP